MLVVAFVIAILSVCMLNVNMLTVIMANVEAPHFVLLKMDLEV